MDTFDRIKDLRQKAVDDLAAIRREVADTQKRFHRKKAEIGEYDAALKVLQSLETLPQSNVDRSIDLSISGSSDSFDIPSVEGEITAKDAINFALKDADNSMGLKVVELRNIAHHRFGLRINPKTASNILWKLKEEGKARSVGHRWFPKIVKQNDPSSKERGSS